MAFDLHGTDWTPEGIERLRDVLCKFPDFFSKFKSGFDPCSLMPFVISVPEGSAPVMPRPHRINPIMAKKGKTTLDQYLVVGVIQHSNSPYPSPLVIIPKKSGGVRITGN